MDGMLGNDHVDKATDHLRDVGKFDSSDKTQTSLAFAAVNATLGLAYEQRTTAMVEAAAVFSEYDPEFGSELRSQVKKRLGYAGDA